MVQSQPGQIVPETLSRKISNTKNRADEVTQVVECLPSKCEALFELRSSNPSDAKKKKKIFSGR
jgi:hypothetical protein